VVKQQKDGYLLMTLKVSLGPELLGWIMRWHEDVEVLGPKELRSQVIDAVKKMSRLYGSN
jgi:predicted DNA-binding transcriptional regulator YafY